MKRLTTLLLTATVLSAAPFVAQVAAQTGAKEIAYDAAQPLQQPADEIFGEVAGVATDSKGDVYVLTHTGDPLAIMGGSRVFAHGGTRLYEYSPTGAYMRQIGAGVYAFLVGAQVRIDPQDNIWVVDGSSNTIMEFNQAGREILLLGRKSEDIPAPARDGPPAGDGAGPKQDVFNHPADIAWDAAGDIFVADGMGNARVAKFNKDGVFVTSWGKRGAGHGEFSGAHSVRVDAKGDVYVADQGNKRIQVFDNNGTFKQEITGVGAPQALCITSGPHQYLYSSNSNPVNDIDTGGEIYKLELDGTVVGKFGHAGKAPKEFGTVNQIDCRNANSLYVAEIGNYRVQKLTLR